MRIFWDFLELFVNLGGAVAVMALILLAVAFAPIRKIAPQLSERAHVTQTAGELVSTQIDIMVTILAVGEIENAGRIVASKQVQETREEVLNR